LGFDGFSDLRVQLLPRAAQQAAVSSVLHQRVLKAVDRFGRRAVLEHQLRSHEASKGGSPLIPG